MKKFEVGSMAIILGALILSLELYGLKIVQGFEMIKGQWFTDSFRYASETPILSALIITIGVIIYGLVLIVLSFKEKNNNP